MSAGSLYEHVGGKLGALIHMFGLGSAGPLIERSYELLCKESLTFPRGQRPVRSSRMNADGTPFQFSLTLGASKPRLQFVTETGAPHLSTAGRLSADRDRIRRLASLCGAEGQLSGICALLDDIAPPDDAELLAEDAGATWIGMGFSPDQRPRFKIYVNVKAGDARNGWARLDKFCAHLGATALLREVRELVEDELEPLGVSLVIGARASWTGRIYLSGYGKPFGYYEGLGGRYGGDEFQHHLRRYGAALLREDYAYPTRSAVCSLGLQSGLPADFKVELCGHCAFESDVQANARCAEWLGRAGQGIYVPMVELLSGGELSTSEAKLHAYLGTGAGRGRPYSTFYFNPAA